MQCPTEEPPVDGRIELTSLAVSLYGVRSGEIADLINKHPSSMSRWLNQRVTGQREHADSRERMNSLDRQISSTPCDNDVMRRVAPLPATMT